MLRSTRRAIPLICLAAFALALAACGSDEASGSTGSLTVTGATVDVSPNPSQVAVRFVIENRSGVDDQVVSASASIGKKAEIHRSKVDDEGRATMDMLSSLDVPAGQDVAFEPGGLHVMITGIAEPLAAGDHFDLVMTFAEAGPQTVDVTVVAPGSASSSGGATGEHAMDHDMEGAMGVADAS